MKGKIMLITTIFLLACAFVGVANTSAEEVYTNGNFTNIVKGVAYSPHMPGEGCTVFEKANYTQDFEWIVEANINTIRTYDWVSEEILDNATKYHVAVIEGIWITQDGDFSDESFKESCKVHIAEVVNRDKDKDCIIGWCIGNELREDVVERVGKEETENFLKELYEYTKSLDSDPNHFVTHANWPPLDNLDMSFFDVIGFNVYSYWPPKIIYKGYFDYLGDLKEKYPNKPLLITEFGYSTSPVGQGNYGYGGNSEVLQAEGIKKRWQEIVNANCIGGIVFEWDDEWWKNNCFGEDKDTHEIDDAEEWFGIIAVEGVADNYTLRKKLAYYAVQEIFGSDEISPSPTNAASGFEMGFAIIGLLIMTCFIKRKRRGENIR